MPEIGLFPLGIVLVPTERVPLHIFEPRYKELISECIEEESEFGLVYVEDDDLRRVGTFARVTDVLEVLDDGRMNVVVEGGERFAIVELTEGRPYQTAYVEPLADEEADAPVDERERPLELFRRLVVQTESEVDEPDEESPLLAYELAARVEFEPKEKQLLLELRSERERLRRLTGLLEDALRAVELARVHRDIASRNGHVSPDRPEV